MWRKALERGLSFSEYLATGTPMQQAKWQAYRERVSCTPSQRELLGGFTRRMNVLVVSGIWCGDCARQGPIIAAIADAAPTVNLRFLDNQADEAVRDELRIHGASRVPVVVTLSEDLFEVQRFGDRTLSAYRRKAHTELGDACDAGIVPPSDGELACEVQEWIDLFERQHLMLRLSPFLRKRHED
jgi:hypothetical protein